MRRRDYHGGSYICVLQIEPTSEQVSQTVLQVSQTVLQLSFADSVTMELVGLQRPSIRRRDYHGGSYICDLQIEPTSDQVSQTVLQVLQTVL